MTQTLHTVAVIGGGTMGAGIVEVAASAGHSVLLYDISADAITRAVDGIAQRPLPASAVENSALSRRRRCWRVLLRQLN